MIYKLFINNIFYKFEYDYLYINEDFVIFINVLYLNIQIYSTYIYIYIN